MMAWEPQWRYSGGPAIGDYIQVDWEYPTSGDSGRHEGLVVAVNEDGVVKMSPEGPSEVERENPYAVRWRKGALPEYDEASDRRELEETGV